MKKTMKKTDPIVQMALRSPVFSEEMYRSILMTVENSNENGSLDSFREQLLTWVEQMKDLPDVNNCTLAPTFLWELSFDLLKTAIESADLAEVAVLVCELHSKRIKQGLLPLVESMPPVELDFHISKETAQLCEDIDRQSPPLYKLIGIGPKDYNLSSIDDFSSPRWDYLVGRTKDVIVQNWSQFSSLEYKDAFWEAIEWAYVLKHILRM